MYFLPENDSISDSGWTDRPYGESASCWSIWKRSWDQFRNSSCSKPKSTGDDSAVKAGTQISGEESESNVSDMTLTGLQETMISRTLQNMWPIVTTFSKTNMQHGGPGYGWHSDTTAVWLCVKIHFSHSFVNIKNIMLAPFTNIFYWNWWHYWLPKSV